MAKLRGSDLDTSDWGPSLSERKSGCLAAKRSAYLPVWEKSQELTLQRVTYSSLARILAPIIYPSDSKITNMRTVSSIPYCPPEPKDSKILQFVSWSPQQISMFE